MAGREARTSRALARLRAPNPAAPVTEALRLPELAERDAYRTMNLAMRIGELLLSGGAGAGDVTATIRAVTLAAGLERCEADVTYTVISISYLRSLDAAPITGSRFVRRYGFDGTRLSRVHEVVEAMTHGDLDVATAIRADRRDPQGRAPLPPLGHDGGLGRARRLGRRAAGRALDRRAHRLRGDRPDRPGQPLPHRQAGAVLLPVRPRRRGRDRGSRLGLAAAGLQVSSSLVIASGIVTMLPGGLFVGSVQDAIGGFLVTAAARALEVFVLTAGLLTGIAVALDVGRRFGVRIDASDLDAPLQELPVRVLAASIAAGLYALANYAPRRILISASLVGGAGFALNYGLVQVGVSATTATAGAAIAMGVACHALAGRVRIAPLLLVVPAIVPQLPGLLVFRGLQAVSGGETALGFSLLLSAVSVGFALAAGILLGQLVAQPTRREQSRLERRRGPHLIGPLRRHRGT